MRVPSPLGIPLEVQRALSALAVLPEIGVHVARLAKDMRSTRESVNQLPGILQNVEREVVALRADMNVMRADVAELRALEEHIVGLRADLGRLPFLGRRQARG
jgi:hypothetical protein